MIDKRKFHYFLNESKDKHPEFFDLLESIQNKFEETIPSITKNQVIALKQYPIQFVNKIDLERGNWTSQLHVWAEHCVPEILDLDPIYLAFKNSIGDTVLMSFIIGATGAYTEAVKYDLIKKILEMDLSYEDSEKTADGKETITLKNALDEVDVNGSTILDFLTDYAFGTGQFDGQYPDEELKNILIEFSHSEKPKDEAKEDTKEVVKEVIEPTVEEVKEGSEEKVEEEPKEENKTEQQI
jgi:hypothetical protein